jgi:hypothetical protein
MPPSNDDFARALIASGPTDAHPKRMATFGRLVGSWKVRGAFLSESTREWTETDRTWIFSYVLGGRAVQDVLLGSDGDAGSDDVAGTTVRVYDPIAGMWRISWFGTLAGDYCTLAGTAHKRDGIRQDGTQTDGRPIRWNFSKITDESFAWDGWVSDDDGRTWWLEQHMDAARVL